MEIKRNFLDNYVFLIPAVILTVFVIVLNLPLTAPVSGADSQWYIAIAHGRINEVIKPFSGRFLHPFLVGQLNYYFSAGINESFLLIAVVSLFLFFVINSFLFKKTLPSPFLMIPLFLSPYFAAIFREFFQPDIFYIFLTAVFFLLIFYKKENLGLLTLFILFLARESTIFLGLIMLVVASLHSKKTLFISTLFVIILSVSITYYINNMGLPNAHNLNNFTYIFLKIPYNFIRNVLGIQPWVNTLSGNCNPVFRSDLPQWLKLGSVNSFGFCGFDIHFPLNAAVSLFTIFGVMPTVLFFAISHRFKFIVNQAPAWLIIALAYGVGYYFISLITTTGVQRIMGYGWPAFLLAAPFLVGAFFQVDKNFIIKISLIQIFVVWLPMVVGKVGAQEIGPAVLIILISLAAHFYTFRLLKIQKWRDELTAIEFK